MKKGIKKGALVTGYAWEYGKRIYGRIEKFSLFGREFKNGVKAWRCTIVGKWGIRDFSVKGLHPVKTKGEKP